MALNISEQSRFIDWPQQTHAPWDTVTTETSVSINNEQCFLITVLKTKRISGTCSGLFKNTWKLKQPFKARSVADRKTKVTENSVLLVVTMGGTQPKGWAEPGCLVALSVLCAALVAFLPLQRCGDSTPDLRKMESKMKLLKALLGCNSSWQIWMDAKSWPLALHTGFYFVWG